MPARRRLRTDCERAADTIMLGPSDPALTTLINALRKRVEPEMWQGAVLSDRSAREDYTLFVYECDITEGSDGDNPKHRPRKGHPLMADSRISFRGSVAPFHGTRCPT